MVFFHQNIDTAKPTERYDIPPYHVDSFPGFDAQRPSRMESSAS